MHQHEINPGMPEIPGYDHLEPISRGATGTVYRATQTNLNRPVAIKVLRRSLVRSERYVKRFVREAKLAAKIDHPNAIHVYDVGRRGRYWYLVMEYVPGESLGTILRREGRLAAPHALEIAEQIASALAQAHRIGIIHRDVKPSNIIIGANGQAKLADLGLAKHVRSADERVTRLGAAVGTPAYMAPEQCRGAEYDARADIYSLGATLYHMLAGRPPFEAENELQVMRMQVEEPLTPLSRHAPNLTPATCAVVHKMLAKDPAQRYGSAEELLADLRALRLGQVPRALVDEQARLATPAPHKSARRTWIAAACVATSILLLGLALAVAAATRAQNPRALLAQARQREEVLNFAQAAAIYERLAATADASVAAEATEGAARVRAQMQHLDLWQQVQQARAAGDWAQAVRLCRQLTQPSSGILAARAAQLEREAIARGYTAAMERARKASESKDWVAAAQAAEEALFFRPSDPSATVARDQARFELLCVSARVAAGEGNYELAIQRYQEALLIRSHPDVARQLQQLRQKADSEATRGRILMALEASSGETWQWDARRLEAIAPIRKAIWDALHAPQEVKITKPHVRPQLLLALHRLGDGDALAELLKLWEAGGPEGDEAARALRVIGKAAAPPLLARLSGADARQREQAAALLTSLGPDVAPDLAAVARHANAPARAAALAALRQMGEPSLPHLVALFQEKDASLRAATGEALVASGPAAAAALLERLPAMEPDAAQDAVQCLKRFGTAIVPRLVDAYASPEKTLQRAAVKVVQQWGGEAIPALLDLVRTGSANQQKAAQMLVFSLGDHATPALLRELRQENPRRAAAEGILRARGAEAMASLFTALAAADPQTAAAAEEAIILIGEVALTPLLRAINEGQPPVARERGVAILKKMGSPGIAALIRLTLHEAQPVREAAAQALMAEPEVTAPIIEQHLRDGNSEVRTQCVRLLVALGHRDSLPQLWRLLRDDSPKVRALVAEAVGVFADERSVVWLEQTIVDPVPLVRLQAVEALGRIKGGRAAEVLVRGLTDRVSEVREAATRSLRAIGEDAFPALETAMKSKDVDLRLRATELIVNIGGRQSVDLLLNALADGSAQVRQTAAAGLGDLGQRRAVPNLVRLLQDASVEVRVAAIEALTKIGDRSVIGNLVNTLEQDDAVEVRLGAVEALAKFGGLEARGALMRAIQNDSSTVVRSAAARALRRM